MRRGICGRLVRLADGRVPGLRHRRVPHDRDVRQVDRRHARRRQPGRALPLAVEHEQEGSLSQLVDAPRIDLQVHRAARAVSLSSRRLCGKEPPRARGAGEGAAGTRPQGRLHRHGARVLPRAGVPRPSEVARRALRPDAPFAERILRAVRREPRSPAHVRGCGDEALHGLPVRPVQVQVQRLGKRALLERVPLLRQERPCGLPRRTVRETRGRRPLHLPPARRSTSARASGPRTPSSRG